MLLYIGDRAFHIPATHIAAHHNAAPTLIAADLSRTGCILHVGDFRQRDELAVEGYDWQFGYIGNVLPVQGVQAKHQIETAFVFEYGTRCCPGKSRTHRLVQIARVQAVTRHAVVAVLHHNLSLTIDLFGLEVDQSGHMLNQGLHVLRGMHERIKIVAENFHGNVGTHPRHHFVETHFNGLCELKSHAGYCGDCGLNLLDQFGFGFRFCPHRRVFQQNDVVGCFNGHRVGRNFCGADFGYDLFHLVRKLFEDHFLHQPMAFQGLRQRTAWREKAVHHDVAFIECRNKLTSQTAK